MNVTVLGSNSAVPSIDRWTSAHHINVDGSSLLFDCGEGTQIRLKQYGLKLNAIDRIFISHLHGDHYFGLAGLVSSYHLLSRKKALEIYGPKELEEIIMRQLEVSDTQLCYKLSFYVVNPNKSEKIYSGEKYEVSSIPLKHRVDTTGYIIKTIAQGKKQKQKSYAYCTDTVYKPDIVDIIEGVDLLYHEATFLSDLQEQAKSKFHSTAKEAAMIAKAAKAKRLIIGHFSKRYKDPIVLQQEAQTVFENTMLVEDGLNISI